MYAHAHWIIDCSTFSRAEPKGKSNAKLHGSCSSNDVRGWQSKADMHSSTDVTYIQHSRYGGAEPGIGEVECNAREAKAVEQHARSMIGVGVRSTSCSGTNIVMTCSSSKFNNCNERQSTCLMGRRIIEPLRLLAV